MKNIFKRNNNYQFRININNELYKYFNCKLYIKSLHTKEKSHAIKLRNILYNKFKIIKDACKMGMTDEHINNLVEDFKNTKLDILLNDFNYITNTKLDSHIEDMKLAYENQDYSYAMELAETIMNVTSEDDYNDFEKIAKLITEHTISKLTSIKDDVNKNIDNTENFTTTSSSSNNIYLKDLVEKYINEYSKAKNWSDSYKNTQYKYVSEFEKYFYNKNIADIKRSDIIDFRDKYLCKLKKTNSNELLSKSSINHYLTAIASFFKYLLINDYISKNICVDIKLKINNNDEIQRVSYTDEDIHFLLNFFTNITSKYKYEFIAMISIAMYSGMRQNEILQLTTSDIVTIDNVMCFSVNDDNNKKVKNKHSIRLVPIHSELTDVVKYLINNATSNNLFSMTRNYFSKKYSQYNSKCGFGETKVFHSFRHTVSNKLKQASVTNTVIDELTGHAHSASSMSLGRYSNRYNVSILKDAIEKIKY